MVSGRNWDTNLDCCLFSFWANHDTISSCCSGSFHTDHNTPSRNFNIISDLALCFCNGTLRSLRASYYVQYSMATIRQTFLNPTFPGTIYKLLYYLQANQKAVSRYLFLTFRPVNCGFFCTFLSLVTCAHRRRCSTTSFFCIRRQLRHSPAFSARSKYCSVW